MKNELHSWLQGDLSFFVVVLSSDEITFPQYFSRRRLGIADRDCDCRTIVMLLNEWLRFLEGGKPPWFEARWVTIPLLLHSRPPSTGGQAAEQSRAKQEDMYARTGASIRHK
jgi:hypothetical protein